MLSCVWTLTQLGRVGKRSRPPTKYYAIVAWIVHPVHTYIQSWARDNTAVTTWPCSLLHYVYIRCGYPLIHRDLNIFRTFSCPWSPITLSCCRCREAKHLSRAQLCIYISPELVPEPLGRLPVEAVGHGGQDTQTQLALHISTTDRLCSIRGLDNPIRKLSTTLGRLII